MRWKPKDYQQLGVDHLLENDKAVLFAGCGLGKTSMCLQAMAEKLLLGDARGFLIVAPLRVATLTWPTEIAKWKNFSWMETVDLRAKGGMDCLREGSGSGHVFCINYEQLPKLAEALKGLRFSKWPFDHVIWDELNFAKNPKSKRIRAGNAYLHKCVGKWGLTGTPTPNSLLELFAQIKLIDGGERLGRTFSGYRDRYFFSTDFMRRSWAPHSWASEKVCGKIDDICLTLRSEDWLGVPETEETDLGLSLPKDSRAIYDELKKELIALIGENEITAANAAVLVNKLLQVTSGAIYDEEGDWHLLHDAKMDLARKFVASASGPVLVACSFRHEQARLAAAIPGSVRFDSVPTSKLPELMEEWEAGGIPALISHAASIGHGIDGFQHGCENVLWTTLPWSRGLYDQLNSRIIRMGQENRTTISRIIIPDTIDAVVAEALRAKAEGQSGLLKTLALIVK